MEDLCETLRKDVRYLRLAFEVLDLIFHHLSYIINHYTILSWVTFCSIEYLTKMKQVTLFITLCL
jgi:hypothetical protein